MKIITIVGARPQFVKAAMVSRAIVAHNRANPGSPIQEMLLHTGQHYDPQMSDVFFRELSIPQPTWQLDAHYAHHGEMTGNMLIAIERILLDNCPDYVLVYGDTNSTLAGALAASKLHIPVIHVEAGLRSFNKAMPEEINRILTDHVSSLLCCPTFAAIRHLANEGIHQGVHHVGDVMYDAALLFGNLAEQTTSILNREKLESKSFYLCTIHRAENTDKQERLQQIIKALVAIATAAHPVVLPLHPRTRQALQAYGLLSLLENHPGIKLIAPLPFLDMVMLEKHADLILTDSGGVQKEAYFHHTPCITLREETEWVETVEAGWNQVAGYHTEQILRCVANMPIKRNEILDYGSGKAAETIIQLL
ncbi:UDP-N-acetylglucosamine 2-epimerase (non-hydrolyzing) [Parabacteroides sp. OttesenSCG-928-G06]|nr:UDP-N-acetylglucosamine 2-epimerase (non-hydrolyzing) [Parabacteroides sp. OttesenSCG-928-G06]